MVVVLWWMYCGGCFVLVVLWWSVGVCGSFEQK